MKYTIVRNAVQCKKCGAILESKHRHDFVSCPCGVFVDGGHEYLRGGWPSGAYEDWVIELHEHKETA
jgi:hypothetical protein